MIAQGLPVAAVPEQIHIAPVRLDVVDHGGGRNDAASLAVRAERMLAQEAGPGLLPAVGVGVGLLGWQGHEHTMVQFVSSRIRLLGSTVHPQLANQGGFHA